MSGETNSHWYAMHGVYEKAYDVAHEENKELERKVASYERALRIIAKIGTMGGNPMTAANLAISVARQELKGESD